MHECESWVLGDKIHAACNAALHVHALPAGAPLRTQCLCEMCCSSDALAFNAVVMDSAVHSAFQFSLT